ncbi:NeuD/PglB/VioB family sugar acetyltransferase [Oceanimonas sp. CAM02]|uniref:NeuD/PglB/VioB family sugar acetyltransferase n=1 Tax=Oceanimonas sp. CAM02 TaxID=3080336 RepID=UPI00293624ED|nr:NeuD/PglB/VioB family sugar acetyltransferase [Oceanimonas sp. CAM02]MDV2857688.1 NeuD/PglB/VioB family sugar acetyltransferase [Oceanimonas sp. CAM02]
MSKPLILLIGGGGHCHSVIDVLELQNQYQIYGIVDTSSRIGSTVLGYPVLGSDEDLPQLFERCTNALITVGHIQSSALRIKLFKAAKNVGFMLPAIVSPLAYTSRYAQLGEGTVVMHHALVNANARIGVNCIINSKALIEHDTKVGNHCHIATAAIINGGAQVEDHIFVGSNSVIIQGAQVHSFVKAGRLHK